ncbi:MAG: hypothetical protein O7F12_03735 [Nitrospirae bacterium]|nr:hypothetical protein [Nitrospirota bacterium]
MMTALWSAGITTIIVILILLYTIWTSKGQDRTPQYPSGTAEKERIH